MAKTKKKLEVINKSTLKTTMPLSFLTPLQGKLKDLSEANHEKLKKSILKNGFIYPLFVWENPDDAKIYLIDGHQRFKVLTALKDEGYSIPQLPVVEIPADSEADAKQKLAMAASTFGSFNQEGVKEFFTDFDPSSLGDFAIPHLDFGSILEPDDDSLPPQETITVSEHERKINDYKEAPLPDLANADAPDFKQMTFIIHIDQLREIEKAISKAKNNEKFDDEKNENSNGNSLYFIAKRYNEKIG